MTNWMPRVLGPMSLRPGLGYIGTTASNLAARFLPFIFSTTDTALLEFTNGAMRVWVNDALITRPSVSTAISNGNFDTTLTDWTDNDESGATSAWVTGGYMGLTGTGANAAIRDQTVTVSAGDQNKVHALTIVIQRGPVVIRVGSTSGGDEYINETTLLTGTHSLAFTPTGNFYVRFLSRLERQTLVSSCNVAGAGVMSITSPYTTADLGNIRHDQSGDVVFLACDGVQQYRVERRDNDSWSVVLYQSDNGPFQIENVDDNFTITPSAISGNITLTASRALFRSTNVGGLFLIRSAGQNVSSNIAAQNTFTNSITVTGVSTSRSFTVSLTGTWVATVTLQRSFDGGSSWIDVTTYAANTTTTYSDGLDNQEIKYRIGVKTGDYTSGTVAASLAYTLGSITGVARITGYTSATSVSAEVLSPLGATTATAVWAEGEWSDRRGWPSAVRLHEGRLWWAGKGGIWGSVSDAYDSFDPDYEGDAAPINREIGSGPVDTINWLLSLQRMIIGAQGAEFSARSSSLDEPLTPTNFNIKPASTEGSSSVDPMRINQRGIYVDRTGIKVFELAFDGQSYDYNSKDLTEINPELGLPGIVRMAVQRKPDTRIHCVRSDGTAMINVYDQVEDVKAWIELETDGSVEDVVVLPGANGSTEDQVYYCVKRTINGSDVRYLEKWAKEVECRGTYSTNASLNKQADSFIVFSNSPASTTVSGLDHLIGESVVVWQDGVCPQVGENPKTFTVSVGGTITLDTAATAGVVGLAYTAQFKSTKLGMQSSALMTLLTEQKRLSHLGLVLAWVHAKGLRYGPDFTNMNAMPGVEKGKAVSTDDVRQTYADQTIEFPGTWDIDMRVCLKAQAPLPCTVLAATIDMEVHD